MPHDFTKGGICRPMKKKILAFVCAMTMVVGMGVSAFAASPAAGTVSTSSNATATTTTTVEAPKSEAGQTIADTTLAAFAKEATVEGATVTTVTTTDAAALVAEANKVADKAFIASIVDITAPAGSTVTVKGVSNVWAGQKVLVLHKKADGTIETIVPSKVADHEVTFTSSTFSPFAIVVDTTATTSPKTRDIVVAMSIIAMMALAGAAVAGKKVRQ